MGNNNLCECSCHTKYQTFEEIVSTLTKGDRKILMKSYLNKYEILSSKNRNRKG
jgi:hypothetical protein